MDFTKVPKQFCDNINVAFTSEFFLMAVASGEAAVAYALTPQHAKRLTLMMSQNIASFEKQFGEIKAEWPEKIPSPIQSSDLGKK